MITNVWYVPLGIICTLIYANCKRFDAFDGRARKIEQNQLKKTTFFKVKLSCIKN